MRRTTLIGSTAAFLAGLALTLSGGSAGTQEIDNDGRYATYGVVRGVKFSGYPRNASCSVTTDITNDTGREVVVSSNNSAGQIWFDDGTPRLVDVPAPILFRLPPHARAQLVQPVDRDPVRLPLLFTVDGDLLARPVPRYGVEHDTGAHPRDCAASLATSSTLGSTSTSGPSASSSSMSPPSSSTLSSSTSPSGSSTSAGGSTTSLPGASTSTCGGCVASTTTMLVSTAPEMSTILPSVVTSPPTSVSAPAVVSAELSRRLSGSLPITGSSSSRGVVAGVSLLVLGVLWMLGGSAVKSSRSDL